jgi:PAS domain S-box-containing protein
MSWTLTKDNNGKPKNIITVARDITERKKAEKAFIENEKKCQALFDNVSDGIMLADIKSQKFFNANKVMSRMLGYSREEINKLGVMDIHPRKDLPYVIEQFEKMARNEITLAENIPVKRKDGSVFYADIGSAPITLAGKSYLLGSFRDITERKKAEEIKGSQERLKLLFEYAPDAYYLSDLKGTFIDGNIAAEKMLGYKREELIGKSFLKLKLLSPRHILKAAKLLGKNALGIPTGPDELTLNRKDGSQLTAEISTFPMKIGERNVVLGMARDITERKRAEEELKKHRGHLEAQVKKRTQELEAVNKELRQDITERKKVEEALKESEAFIKTVMDNLPIGIAVNSVVPPVIFNYMNDNFPKHYRTTRENLADPDAFWEAVYEESEFRNEIKTRILDDCASGDLELMHWEDVPITREGEETSFITARNIPLPGKQLMISTVWDVTKRKRAEEALADSEGYLARLLDSIGSGIMVIDPADHRIVEVNSYAAKMIGTSKDKIIGRKCHKFICPKDEGQCPVTDLGQTIDHSERLLVKANGERLPVLKSVSEILRNGKSYLVESLVDITERKEVEERLMHAAEEWRTTFDSINDLVSVHDRNYRFLRVNKAFARAFGKEPKELIGKACYEVVHGTSGPPPYCPNIAVLKTKKAATAEYYELKSGIYLQVTSWPVLNDKGEVAISIHVARDITERKKAEVVLQKSERNFRNSIDNSPLGVSIITRDGRLVYANRAFLNIYGYKSVAELKSVPLSKRYTPESYKRRLERQEMGKRSLPIPKSYEISIIRKDGEIRNLQVTWENVFWDGQPRVQVIYQDITERRKMQEQLIITDRLASVGELAAGVAHELNNPLTGVIGFSQLLLEKDIPEDIREDVDIIYREARRSAEVVKNLLTFARKHVPQKRLLSLNSVIEKVLQLRAYEQRVNNIAVVNRLDPNLPQAMSDEFQLQQVFLNIILNAEFSMIEARHGGTLTVTTEKVDNVVRASISDDGPGISKLALGHLFDPFFTTKEVGKGTGLGLSICHGIVNEHGGRIYAESPPGEGATFIVELPLNRNAKKDKGN